MGFDRQVGEAVGWLSLFPDFGICFGFWILIYGYFMFILDVIWSAGGWSRWLSLLRKCTWCIAPPLRDLGLDFGFWYMEGFSYIGCDILEMRSDRRWMKQMIVITRRMHHLLGRSSFSRSFKPVKNCKQLRGHQQTGGLHLQLRSKQAITQFQPESQRCCHNSVIDRAHQELSFGVKTVLWQCSVKYDP